MKPKVDSLKRSIKLINVQKELQQERTQIAAVRSGRGTITAGPTGIKRTVKEH